MSRPFDHVFNQYLVSCPGCKDLCDTDRTMTHIERVDRSDKNDVRILMWCEMSWHTFWLTLTQHKGITIIAVELREQSAQELWTESS